MSPRRPGLAPRPPAIAPVPRDELLPLSWAQQRVWFQDQFAPRNTARHMCLAWRIRGAFDLTAAARVLAAIVERHEILRTTFVCRPWDRNRRRFGERDGGSSVRAGEPGQQIHASAPILLPVIAVAADEVAHRVSAERRRPFDLQHGPLWRALALRVGPADYVWIITWHPIVGDRDSLRRLAREIETLYAGGHLPPLPVQHADVAAWQRRSLIGGEHDRAIEYWRRRLADLAPLDLPADRPRPAIPTGRAAAHDFMLPPPLGAAVRALSRRAGVAPFQILLAAFLVLLHRVTGRTDLAVGIDLPARRQSGTDALIGLFANEAVLRVLVAPCDCLRDVLARVRAAMQEADDHGALPFARVIDLLQPPRDPSRPPLFHIKVCAGDDRDVAPRLGDAQVETLAVASDATPFDLTVSFTERGPVIAGALEFATDLFARETIARFAAHYERTLRQLLAAPATGVREIALLDDGERAQVLACARPRVQPRAADDAPCLCQWFEEQVTRSGEAIAVELDDLQVSYATLWSRAGALAARLQALGIGPEVPVAIWCERGLGLLIGVLGVVRAGGIYVPIDPHTPLERVRWLLGDCGARALVSERPLAARLDPSPVPIVDATASHASRAAAGQAADAVSADAPPRVPALPPTRAVYMIYTSGSTGRPKGVLVTEGNLARLVASTREPFQFSSSDIWTLFHSAAFDFSVWEMWACWLTGGRLVVVPYEVSRAPDAFHTLLRRAEVTVLNQTPSAFELWQGIDHHTPLEALAVRLVIFGGEALDPVRLGSWLARRGTHGPSLVNMYGITETTVHVTRRTLTAGDAAAGYSVIGAGLDEAAPYVLDGRGALVPIGVPGELHVGGAGVARGYANQAALTAERFRPDPFGGEAGARLYRSGDRVRWRAQGDLEYLGRLDAQIKVRGYRIEPGEIEAVLRRHHAVRQAVILAVDGERGKRLVAYVVLDPDETETIEIETLRAHLRAVLPEYMVPGAIVPLSHLPLTVNGKLDHRALPPPSSIRTAAAADEPRTDAERALVDAWASILAVDRLGIHDNFFERGGDSMAAVRVVSKVRALFQTDVPLRTLFDRPTVASWAECLPPLSFDRRVDAPRLPLGSHPPAPDHERRECDVD